MTNDNVGKTDDSVKQKVFEKLDAAVSKGDVTCPAPL